ncbi:MAG TPA: mycofactocin-coupled SDR family oxidoreductase [Nocardioides sp.]|nr:mycofactocin-coupled SDR family oxidoreductase [Nocardioides sp.]
MAKRLEGKVSFITGAGRGQGRAHAVRQAEEGASIIAVDLCQDIPSVKYPMSTREDLAETERLVKEAGGQILARVADVRERSQLKEAIDDGVAQFGGLDIVVANAGILPAALGHPDPSHYIDAIDVDYIGAVNAVSVSLPHIRDNGSILITGSTAALLKGTTENPAIGPGGAGYAYAKRSLCEFTEQLAMFMAPRSIRVNIIHPTNVNTHLIHNDGIYSVFRPDLEKPTLEDAQPAFQYFQALPIPWIEPVDVANLGVFLASEEGRYITAQQIKLDAGSMVKWPDGPQG